ncbi:MAG: hypothetical protein WBC44_22710, partial [Planctomycetaceae bacterium]
MIRKTLHWLLILLVLAGAGGSGVAWYVWVQGDEYARQELQRRLSEIGPECDLQIGKVRFDWDRLIHVYDFAVRAKGKDAPATFVAPEAVLQIDREQFLNDQTVDVQMIRLIRPTFDVTRRADGTWTVEDLMPFRLDPSLAVPEWQIEDATIRFRLEQPQGKPVVLTLQNADLRLVPAGRRQLTIRGLSDVANAGPLQIEGRVDLDRGTWSLAGSVNGLNTSGDIAGFVLGSSPELRDQVATLRDKLRDVEHSLLADDESGITPGAVPYRTASRSRETSAATTGRPADVPNSGFSAFDTVSTDDTPRDLTGLGINATLDLSFAFSKREHVTSPEYQVQVKCKDGQIVNPLLPFALRHLRGELYWDNTTLRLTSFQADGGGTILKLDGGFQLGGPSATGNIDVEITDLTISDQYSGQLPPVVDRFLEVVRPSGPVDLAGSFDRDAEGRWSARDFVLEAKGAAATPEPFPVPIRDITGTLRLVAPGRIEARMTGKIGARPVRLVAGTRSADGGAEVGVQINAEAVPLDETFREACNAKTQAVLAALDLEGNADVEVHLYRPAGPRQKYDWWFKAHVADGELEYERLPYRLSQLSGDVSYNSENRLLRFWNVTGQHGRSIVRGGGSYCSPPELRSDGTAPIGGVPPGLTLELLGEQVVLGDDLRSALPTSLKQMWEELNLDGQADMTVKVAWVPGAEPRIEIPRFDLTEGVLNGRAFPYLLHTIAAKASYTPASVAAVGDRQQVVPARVTITDFVGWHDGGVRVAAHNATVDLLPDGVWRLDLPTLDVEDLTLGAEFLRAIPEGFRKAIEVLDPQGHIDVSGRLTLQGARSPRTPISGDWNLVGKLVDATTKPGLEVTHATGDVSCEGTFRGNETDLSGQIDLERAKVFGQWIENIRGPFALKDGQVRIGSQDALADRAGANTELSVPIEQQLTASYLEPGLLTLNALVNLEETPSYRGRVTLTGGSLEQYTRAQPGSAQRQLAGVMNGWIDFNGRGTDPSGVTGQGQLRINPAELYELPVIMQTFNILFPVPPDNTAFRSARLNFVIRDKAFLFERRDDWPIVLTGDSLRLIGVGRVAFDGRLRLEMITTLPQ